MLKKWSCNFHSNCQNTLWFLIKCSLRFSTLDNSRKNGPITFLHWEVCLFFNLCFQQPLRCYRNDLATSTVIVRIPCWASKTVPWALSHSIMGEKIGQNLFFTGKFAFFSKKIVLSTTSLVLQKRSCNFHSNCQNTLSILINCPLRFVTFDNSRKDRPKSFLHWKECIFFSKICVFNNFLGVTELIL